MKYIYGLQCTINGKIYIGQTNNVQRRKCEHIRCLKRDIHHNHLMQDDYNKYGLSKFNFIILEACEDDEVNDKEDYHMRIRGGIENDTIYNYQDNKTQNKEMINKISESKKGNVVSEETRRHLSDALMGHKLTEQSKRKISRTKSSNKPYIDVPYGNNERKYSKEFINELRELRNQGYTFVELQNKYNICRTIISNLVHYGKSNGLKNTKINL